MDRDNLFRIAKWEVTRNSGQFDRRTLAVGGVLLLLLAILLPMVAGQGVTVDEGIYRVGVSEDSPYYEVASQDSTFVVVEPSAQKLQADAIDILIISEKQVVVSDTPKGRAALSEFRDAVKQYNNRQMRNESDQAAAFPVKVSLEYVEQNPQTQTAESPEADGGTQRPETTANQRTAREDESETQGQTTQLGKSDSAERTTETPDDAASNQDSDSSSVQPSNGSLPASGDSGGASLFTDNGEQGTPSGITPPFPFESLVLAFAFILPMNFVIQAYASSIMDERINNRGELLLVSPASPGDIIAGKTLPYFFGMIIIATVTAITILLVTPAGADGFVTGTIAVLIAVLAVIPIALLYLASAFVSAMFARSFKELTFVTISLSVFLTAYAFIPAIFTNIHPIAAISPLTLVVHTLRETSVSLGDYAFSTLPLFLSSIVLFALGRGVYREEDMFTQRPVPLKFLDALNSQLTGPRSVAKLSALSIPFVFVGELLAVAVLFALPIELSLPVLLVVIAGIEELAKSVHIYAGFAHDRFDRSLWTVGLLGSLSGLGFFIGEKATAVAQLVGLPQLDLGRAAFGTTTGLGVSQSPSVLLGLLFAPLALHVITATVTAYGASRKRYWYAATLVCATLLHAAYNFVVVTQLGTV
ncbi:ABC transporter permease subunit [Halorussus salinisoli]|uniref:ABC transporter permease subunit n=1 Tax=Halorussus salinisoli TaxID=2558242 RepID=UPI0010C17F56|nr:ABC transporter permease [Halorussus salinisoli]